MRSREGPVEEHLPYRYAVASGLSFAKGTGVGSVLTKVEEGFDAGPAAENVPEADGRRHDVDDNTGTDAP